MDAYLSYMSVFFQPRHGCGHEFQISSQHHVGNILLSIDQHLSFNLVRLFSLKLYWENQRVLIWDKVQIHCYHGFRAKHMCLRFVVLTN